MDQYFDEDIVEWTSIKKKKMYKKEFIEYIENDGWSIVCESPLEIEHKDGASASGIAAEYVLDELDVEYCNEQNTKLAQDLYVQ